MNKRIFIAGHHGMVGSALHRRLQSEPTAELIVRSRAELDLSCQSAVAKFFANNKIDQIYLAAAKVGGIHANDAYPADFIYTNLMIQCNVIHSAYQAGVKKLLLLGSSCIYPRMAAQPMVESELLTGALEPSNEPYAIAKIAGIKLCESYNRQYGCDYRSVMPTNLYGENDNFHPQNSHVIPGLMRRFHLAKLNNEAQVSVWGSGKPRREFLHVNDMAAACVYLMNLPQSQYRAAVDTRLSHINIGSGQDCTIKELVEIITSVVGYQGEIVFDSSKPDGTPRKLLNTERLNTLGWSASISLRQGLERTYVWFLAHHADLRGVQQ